MILDKIVEQKRKEVEDAKKNSPLDSFKSKIEKSERDFKDAISVLRPSLIAEIKKASPSEGVIREGFDPVSIAKIYKDYAQAISVLTDKEFFKGDLSYLKDVRDVTQQPILRKDFIIDEYQVYESRYSGADAILLIASILSKEQIDTFIDIAKGYNMDCLVEVHTKKELDKVLGTKAEIIGINNRDLDNFNVDLGVTEKLSKDIPDGKIIVSESGISTSEDIMNVSEFANAILIGTSLMKETDIAKKIQELMGV